MLSASAISLTDCTEIYYAERGYTFNRAEFEAMLETSENELPATVAQLLPGSSQDALSHAPVQDMPMPQYEQALNTYQKSD